MRHGLSAEGEGDGKEGDIGVDGSGLKRGGEAWIECGG